MHSLIFKVNKLLFIFLFHKPVYSYNTNEPYITANVLKSLFMPRSPIFCREYKLNDIITNPQFLSESQIEHDYRARAHMNSEMLILRLAYKLLKLFELFMERVWSRGRTGPLGAAHADATLSRRSLLCYTLLTLRQYYVRHIVIEVHKSLTY